METTASVEQARRFATPRRRGADAYDTLLWRLHPRLEDHAGRDGAGFLVGVTGCDRRGGVSTVAANLAIRAADHQMRPTLLIDAATRPSVARSFRLRDAMGLADVIAGRCSLSEAIHDTPVDGLQVMPIGTAGLMDRVGLDHQQVEAMLSGLRESHQMVVFDLPSAAEMRHMLIVARRLDAAVMVLRHEADSRDSVHRAAEQLHADGVNLVGSVVSRRRQYVPNWIRRRF